jgi:drug/metabolite transporter (DMT)-like permease
VRNVPVSKVGTYAYVNPAIAILLGWLILGETITAVTLVGAGVIVAAVALVVRSESRVAEARRASGVDAPPREPRPAQAPAR